MAVAVVERYKQEPMYGLSSGTHKSCCCREVAVVELEVEVINEWRFDCINNRVFVTCDSESARKLRKSGPS